MVSEVDQKYLGAWAKRTASERLELSAALYKVLGLSTLLNRKLVRARKQRKLDPTRPTKSLDLYKHINWMGREGYNIIETIIPLVSPQDTELRVLVHKLKASFLHVFVLFEVSPHTKVNVLSAIQIKSQQSQQEQSPNNGTATPTPQNPQQLKEANYIRPAMEAFRRAYDLAAELLPGIHPLRLSVIVEYSAFTFDCVRDHEESRRLAKKGVDEALEHVDEIEDDEAFADAQDLVGSLAIMSKRPSPQATVIPAVPSPNLIHAASYGDLKKKHHKTKYDLNGNPLTSTR